MLEHPSPAIAIAAFLAGAALPVIVCWAANKVFERIQKRH